MEYKVLVLMEGNSKIVILRQTLTMNTGRMDEISHVHLLCVGVGGILSISFSNMALSQIWGLIGIEGILKHAEISYRKFFLLRNVKEIHLYQVSDSGYKQSLCHIKWNRKWSGWEAHECFHISSSCLSSHLGGWWLVLSQFIFTKKGFFVTEFKGQDKLPSYLRNLK